MSIAPYRGSQYGSGYSAEWLPPHQRTWRILRRDGKVAVFSTQQQAKEAAEAAYWRDPRAKTVAGLPMDEQALADRLAANVEDWLLIRRQDRQAARMHHRAGKRPFEEIPGKVEYRRRRA